MPISRSTIVARTAAATAVLALAACGSGSDSAKDSASVASAATSKASSAAVGQSSQSSTTSSTSAAAGGTSTAAPSPTPGSPTSSGAASASASATTGAAKAPINASAVATAPAQHVAPATSTKAKGTSAPVDLTHVTTPAGGAQTGAAVASQALNATITGRTLTYAFDATGTQHLYTAEPENTVVASSNSSSLDIDFGDGTDHVGANLGAMTCMPKSRVAPFHDTLPQATHTYAKPGTYTITMTTYFCGDAGITSKTSSKQVTIN